VRVAAVDLGTNTTRLLVADVDDGRIDEVHRETHITRLGEGVDARKRLLPVAIARVRNVLADYRRTLERLGAERTLVVATSAVRDAENGEAFLGEIEWSYGFATRLVSGDDEALLTRRGVQPTPGTLVLDIGGGSTELILGTTDVDYVVSMDIGSVRLTEQWLHGDPPTAEELSMAVSVVRTYVDELVRARPDVKEAGRIVGVAGTITTIAAIELGYYDPAGVHHFDLTRSAAEDVFRTVATEPLARRLHNPGLDPKRADVIVGGSCVLVAILRHLDAPGLLVSETDILHGIARSVGR